MMRSYIRWPPGLVEEKLSEGYSLAQIGALAMLMGQAEQQPKRGRFKSMGLLVAAMDCMVEEHGREARASQHIPFLMERGVVVKLEGGGWYVDGWDELQEGNHDPKERMELLRGRKGRPGNPASQGALRQRTYRARRTASNGATDPLGGVTNGVTNPISDASHGDTPGDGHMVRTSDASPGSAPLPPDPLPPRVSSGRRQKAEGSSSSGCDASQPDGTDGLSTEPDEVRTWGERFIAHGRLPSGDDLAFLRRVPYAYDRLGVDVVSAAIDDVAAKFHAQGRPPPKAAYLAGRLGDLQVAASDAGVRPQRLARAATGLTRLGDLLPAVRTLQ